MTITLTYPGGDPTAPLTLAAPPGTTVTVKAGPGTIWTWEAPQQ